MEPGAPNDIDRPQPCDANGIWWEGSFQRPAWTPLGFLRRGERFILVCTCGRRQDAPLQRLVDEGRGDTPLHLFRGLWRCECGSKDISVELGEG
jgi:hypothetical protein